MSSQVYRNDQLQLIWKTMRSCVMFGPIYVVTLCVKTVEECENKGFLEQVPRGDLT